MEEDLRCPDNFNCITPSVSHPADCYDEDGDGEVNTSSIKYCPKGTQFADYCPAGNFCETPNTSEPCGLSHWCPAGTAIEELCPAGTYCPSPAVSLVCPAGFFCRVGSTRAKECLPGARCPEGSAAMDFTTGGIVISTCIIAFVAAVTLGLLYSRKRKMLQLKKSLEVGVELKRAIKVLHQSEQIIRDHEKQMQKIEASMVKIEASMVRTSEASGEVEVDAT